MKCCGESPESWLRLGIILTEVGDRNSRWNLPQIRLYLFDSTYYNVQAESRDFLVLTCKIIFILHKMLLLSFVTIFFCTLKCPTT